jgi:hypothetical protein
MSDANEEILLNLRIVSKIPEGAKIHRHSNGIFVIQDTYVSGIYRFIKRYSRHRSIEDISGLVRQCIRTIKDLYNSIYYDNENYPVQFSERKTQVKNLANALVSASSGLENLRQTYHQDHVSTSKIDLIINEVKDFIPEIKDFLD